jgi:hyaluronoglucosaminidase
LLLVNKLFILFLYKGPKMGGQEAFLLGVIEGFYGRPWTHEARLAYADFLPRLGLNSYLYCPKADPFLRRRWQEPWPEHTYGELTELAQTYAAHNLALGVGLSPFALYQNYDRDSRRALKHKVEYLNSLNMPLLAILFDDMPGALDCLASRQAQIVDDVCAWAPQSRVMVCPTYYSFDPVLEKYFGNRPSDYWCQLGRELPAAVDVFWTGNSVCSQTITAPDVEGISGLLGRQVMLWDNYPVNDGAVRSDYIYSSPLSGRDSALAQKVSGHFCNPMNQALLSLMALTGLGALYDDASPTDLRWLMLLYGNEAYEHLQRDKADFESLGLSGLGAERARELALEYGRLPGKAAQEVAQWLRGEYAFDPACLTD